MFWGAVKVPFYAGETIAAALQRAELRSYGKFNGDTHGRYFCGIGGCQSCLVSVNGASPVEACLTPAGCGMRLEPALSWPASSTAESAGS